MRPSSATHTHTHTHTHTLCQSTATRLTTHPPGWHRDLVRLLRCPPARGSDLYGRTLSSKASPRRLSRLWCVITIEEGLSCPPWLGCRGGSRFVCRAAMELHHAHHTPPRFFLTFCRQPSRRNCGCRSLRHLKSRPKVRSALRNSRQVPLDRTLFEIISPLYASVSLPRYKIPFCGSGWLRG